MIIAVANRGDLAKGAGFQEILAWIGKAEGGSVQFDPFSAATTATLRTKGENRAP
jgi:hypothetical protein